MDGSRTILLVEDEPHLREAMAFALRRRGYEVLTAVDAHEADDLLARGLPDLLVVDMLLPGPSGFQVVRSVRERSDERVPVLMASGNSSSAHRNYAYAAGVDAFLAKPFALAELVGQAEALCPLTRGELAAAR